LVPHALPAAAVVGGALVHDAAGLPEDEELEDEELEDEVLEDEVPEDEVPASGDEVGAALDVGGVAVPAAGAFAGGVVSGAGVGSVGACEVVSPPVSVVVPTAHATSVQAAAAAARRTTMAEPRPVAAGRTFKASSFGARGYPASRPHASDRPLVYALVMMRWTDRAAGLE
jgi:hypothetical protein